MNKLLWLGGALIGGGAIYYFYKKSREAKRETRVDFTDAGMELEVQEPDSDPGVGTNVSVGRGFLSPSIFATIAASKARPVGTAIDISMAEEVGDYVAMPTGAVTASVLSVIRPKTSLGFIVGSNGKVYPIERIGKE